MSDKIIVYQAKDGWRWRRIAPNNRVVSDSGEAYTRKADAEEAAAREAEGSSAMIEVEEFADDLGGEAA